jgi:hypothetical protein
MLETLYQGEINLASEIDLSPYFAKYPIAHRS